MKVTQLILSIHTLQSNEALNSSPEVLIGKLPLGYKPRQPKIVNEEKTWIILHDANYTLYSLYAKNIAVSKTDTSNVSFNLLIPMNKKLGEDFKVLDVLNKIVDLWFKETDFRIDKKSPINNVNFEQYISSIPLEPRDLYFPIMRGEKPAAHCICNKNQLSALLNFSRYPLLSTIAWLEIGHECETTIDLFIHQKKNAATNAPKINNNILSNEQNTKETNVPEQNNKESKNSSSLKLQTTNSNNTIGSTSPSQSFTEAPSPYVPSEEATTNEIHQTNATKCNYTPKQIKPGLFSFRGRYKRKKFILINLLSIIICIFSLLAYILITVHDYELYYEDFYGGVPIERVIPPFVALCLVYITTAWIVFASWVKRFHDLGHSGWIACISFIFNIITQIVFIYPTLFKGQQFDNKYGPNPYK